MFVANPATDPRRVRDCLIQYGVPMLAIIQQLLDFIDSNLDRELTADQLRKPLLGSGEAVPIDFESALGDATLLLATDGLLKYARRDRIAALARHMDLQVAARGLAELPRL